MNCNSNLENIRRQLKYSTIKDYPEFSNLKCSYIHNSNFLENVYDYEKDIEVNPTKLDYYSNFFSNNNESVIQQGKCIEFFNPINSSKKDQDYIHTNNIAMNHKFGVYSTLDKISNFSVKSRSCESELDSLGLFDGTNTDYNHKIPMCQLIPAFTNYKSFKIQNANIEKFYPKLRNKYEFSNNENFPQFCKSDCSAFEPLLREDFNGVQKATYSNASYSSNPISDKKNKSKSIYSLEYPTNYPKSENLKTYSSGKLPLNHLPAVHKDTHFPLRVGSRRVRSPKSRRTSFHFHHSQTTPSRNVNFIYNLTNEHETNSFNSSDLTTCSMNIKNKEDLSSLENGNLLLPNKTQYSSNINIHRESYLHPIIKSIPINKNRNSISNLSDSKVFYRPNIIRRSIDFSELSGSFDNYLNPFEILTSTTKRTRTDDQCLLNGNSCNDIHNSDNYFKPSLTNKDASIDSGQLLSITDNYFHFYQEKSKLISNERTPKLRMSKSADNNLHCYSSFSEFSSSNSPYNLEKSHCTSKHKYSSSIDSSLKDTSHFSQLLNHTKPKNCYMVNNTMNALCPNSPTFKFIPICRSESTPCVNSTFRLNERKRRLLTDSRPTANFNKMQNSKLHSDCFSIRDDSPDFDYYKQNSHSPEFIPNEIEDGTLNYINNSIDMPNDDYCLIDVKDENNFEINLQEIEEN